MLNTVLILTFRGVRFVFRLFPPRLTIFFSKMLGRLALLFFSKERVMIISQFSLALKHDPRLQNFDQHGLPQRIFSHVGQLVGETFLLETLLQENQGAFPCITVSGEREVIKLSQEKKSFLAISGHIGNFELLAAYFVRRGISLTVIGRRPNYASFDTLLKEFRESYGAKTTWRDDPQSTRMLVRTLRSGDALAGVIDQDTHLENAYVPFFGIEAAYPIAGIRLAVKYQLPVFSAFIVRKEPMKHHVSVKRLEYSGDETEAIQTILTQFSRNLEEQICQHPEQWLWWHRRWRRRPGVDYAMTPELLPSTRQYLEWINSLGNSTTPRP